MGKPKNIKTCRYNKCKHDGKVNISQQNYFCPQKGHYYHKDCWEEVEAEKKKIEKTKKDMQYIRNLWISKISNTVVFSELNKCLNDLLEKGVTSDYMVFTMDYIVDHHLNLRYPMGFKYFIDKGYIKREYQRQNVKKQMKDADSLSVENPTDSPSFKINNPKPQGFGSILRGGKQ